MAKLLNKFFHLPILRLAARGKRLFGFMLILLAAVLMLTVEAFRYLETSSELGNAFAVLDRYLTQPLFFIGLGIMIVGVAHAAAQGK